MLKTCKNWLNPAKIPTQSGNTGNPYSFLNVTIRFFVCQDNGISRGIMFPKSK